MTAAGWPDVFQEKWGGLTARHPWLRWMQRWGISVVSLVSGLGTLFIFRRGIEYFPWFIGYLLLVWLAAVVFARMRHSLAARGPRVVWMALDYIIQSLLHGLLLFLLPVYYASTTLTSVNVGFPLLLVAAVVITAIDPWYRATIHRVRWGEIALFWFGLFASLNVAFPLLRVRSGWAIILSGIVSMLALTPAFRRKPDVSWRNALVRAGTCAAGVAVLLWPLRGLIPPVPLHLTTATFARSVIGLEPLQPVSSVSTTELRAWGGLAAFTAVAAPAGLREPIYHVWRKDGAVVARIPLSPVSGGRPGGFRTHSRKTDLGQNPAGSWSVDVVTAHEQLIGRAGLVVTP